MVHSALLGPYDFPNRSLLALFVVQGYVSPYLVGLSPYSSVLDCMHDITSWVAGGDINFLAVQYLLHHMKQSFQQFKRSLQLHMINTACLCVFEWLMCLNRLEEMEKQIFVVQDRIKAYTNMWACWLHLKSVDDYKHLMTSLLRCKLS